MQLTEQTRDLYAEKAPELLQAITASDEGMIMKRDPATDYCVKFDAGWCSIHRDYGDTFLGDACHFYPRVTRALETHVHTTLALSCPEAARQALLESAGLDTTAREVLRVPFSLRNYLPDGLTADAAMHIHELFLREAANPGFSAERNLLRLVMMGQALEQQPVEQWEAAAGFYATMADGRIPPAEMSTNDLFHLAQALHGLMMATQSAHKPKLIALVTQMLDALGLKVAPGNSEIAVAPDAMERGVALVAHWRAHGAALQPVFTRYLQAQLSQAMFPFAGLGGGLSERMTVMAVRFATWKLALMVLAKASGGAPSESAIIEATYVLARFMDHLADATLSLRIYEETGWVRASRLRGLLME